MAPVSVGILSKLWSNHGAKFKSEYVKTEVSPDKINAVEQNFPLFRSLLQQHPHKPPKKKMLRQAIKISDDNVHASDHAVNSPAQTAWVVGQAEQLFATWSFIWTCYRRSPLLSKSIKMQKLKEILDETHGKSTGQSG